MSINLPVHSIILNYECEALNCTGTGEQPLSDIVEVGTAICPDCGDDMVLTSTTVMGENDSYPDRVIDGVTVPNALAPEYGNVLLIVEAHAVSYGTHYACFKPVDAEWGTPVLELKRTTTSATVVRQ